MPDRKHVIHAIRQSWSKETSAVPDEWTPQNPARGQCDASSFVFWELCGGNLVLAEVFVNGEHTEHHYWNRIDGEDIDLSREQFINGEDIREKTVVPNEYMREKIPTMRPELRHRVDTLRAAVQSLMGSMERTDA